MIVNVYKIIIENINLASRGLCPQRLSHDQVICPLAIAQRLSVNRTAGVSTDLDHVRMNSVYKGRDEKKSFVQTHFSMQASQKVCPHIVETAVTFSMQI